MLSRETKFNPGSKLPKYRQLAMLVAKDIQCGVYKIGALIPSINECSRLYGLSTPTVSSAYDILRKYHIIKLNSSNRYIVKSRNIDKFLSEEFHDESAD